MEQTLIVFKRRRIRGLLTQQYFTSIQNNNEIKFTKEIVSDQPVTDIKPISVQKPTTTTATTTSTVVTSSPGRKYITEDQFLGAYHGSNGQVRSIPTDLQGNARGLVQATNRVLAIVSKDLPRDFNVEVSNGFRTWQEHQEIYRTEHPGQQAPKGSAHLTAQALYLRDTNGYLKKAIMKNKEQVAALMEAEGISFENFNMTDTWVHIQTKPLTAHGNQMWNYADLKNAKYR